MKQEVMNEVVEKTRALMDAPSCCSEAKEAAQRWLDALGTEAEKAQTQRYVQELEEDIISIDALIDFAQSEQGKACFGAEAAAVAAHAREMKQAGARYCDCPACSIVEAILTRKAESWANSIVCTSDRYAD